MKMKSKLAATIFSGLFALVMVPSVYAQDFHQGYPADTKAVQKLYDEMDLQRATQA
jgi:outer membrane protein assembly factor BamE (lipoprotein component of BamABCDE complex)